MKFPRPNTVTILLCWLACFGQVPAWLHGSDCAHRHTSGDIMARVLTGQDAGGQAVAANDCCPCHGDIRQASGSQALADGSSEPQHAADDGTPGNEKCPDSCAICHFLAVPTGVTFVVASIPFEFRCLGEVDLAHSPAILPPQLFIHDARGPPTLLA